MIRVSTAERFLIGNQSINQDQSALMTTEAELSSGKQVNSPADNPVGAAQAALLTSDQSQLTQYGANQNQASLMLNNSSSILSQGINILQSTSSLLVQANSSTLSATDKTAIATQLQQQLNQLVGLANTGDSQGGYLFGGSNNSGPPFSQSGNSVTYNGDNLPTSVQISQTRTEQMKYPGSTVFQQIPSGNGTFQTSVGSSNTGTGLISVGSVTSPSAVTGDTYQVQFGAGGSTYSVFDTTTGSSTPVATGSYTSGANISVAGMQFQITGTPAANDTFTVAPSKNESVFGVIANAISALQTTGGSQTQYTASMQTAIQEVSNSMTSFSSTQASMGAQLSELQTYGEIDTAQSTQDQTAISSIVDLNYATGASQFSQQQTQLQAALQSYASVSKLSLFNYV